MNKRRRLTGFVTSDKMDKTVVVEVSRSYRHNLYQKVIHSKNKFLAHDEFGCQIGDQVLIVESRPISRRKRWIVQKILSHDLTAGELDIDETLELEGEELEPEAE